MINSKLLLFLSLSWFLILGIQKSGLAQDISIKRSTLSICGSNPQLNYNGKTYILKQSIGQPGITGTDVYNKTGIIQGYIQPDLLPKNSMITPSLDVNIKQIPYSDYYIITINDEANTINLSIYNTLGQKKYSQNIKSNQENYIDLSSYSSGCYILKIQTNQKQFSTKLIKK